MSILHDLRVMNTDPYNIKSELHIFEPCCEKTGLRDFTNKAVQPHKVAEASNFVYIGSGGIVLSV